MKRIEDLPELLQRIFQQTWYTVEPIDGQFPGGAYLAELFFIAGYEAAIAERAKFDEQAQGPNATAQTFVAFLRFANAIEAEKTHREKKGDEDRQGGLGSTRITKGATGGEC